MERERVQVAKMPVTIPADTIQGASKLLADNLNIAVGELRRLFLGTLFLSCLANHLPVLRIRIRDPVPF